MAGSGHATGEPAPVTPHATAAPAAPAGEMAQRVRDFDWATTPLGPRANWSQSLAQIVAIVLASGFPMAVRWGRDLTTIYNDAYRPILGDKHPASLGKPSR